MKKITFIITGLLVSAFVATFAQGNRDNEAYLQGVKEQVSLPPQIIAFISFKEQQAKDIAQKNGFELPADYENFFTNAKAGRARDAKLLFHNIYKNFNNSEAGTNLTLLQKSPLLQAVLDVSLTDDAFNGADADLVMALGNDFMASLPINCIYFGGTDPGRGLPTMLCKTPGDPVFVLSQNPLVDSRYREYVRETYGARIQFPTTNEFQEMIDAFSASTQRRWQHDQDFPKEPKQLRPGESVHLIDGKPAIEGVGSVMSLNEQLVKAIFDKNPDREFYYEESWPFDSLYPSLSPHGAVMKINRQPLDTVPANAIKADEAFWQRQVAAKLGDWLTADLPLSNICAVVEKIYATNGLTDFKGDVRYIHTEYVQVTYSKLRNSIARVYDWRRKNSQSAEERRRMLSETELAYRQSFVLCPHLPEMAYAYVNFLLENNRLDDALLMVKTALACSPKANVQQFTQLLNLLEGFKHSVAIKPNASPAAAQPSGNTSTAAERLKKVKTLYDQGLITKEDYDKKVKEIMDSL